jgi:methionyl-tRNA formyltransferase
VSNSAILLGSKPGSVVALLELLNRGWDVREVVAEELEQPWLPGPSLFETARAHNIRVVPRQEELISRNVDLIISYMFRKRVKSPTLERARYPINFHAAPLPSYGGWAFYSVAILEEAISYGCTCHIMDEGFDTGPLVKVREFEIDCKVETALSLEKKSQLEMVQLFREVIQNFEIHGTIEGKNQDESKMRYLTFDEFNNLKEIKINDSADEVDRKARAFWYPPFNSAFIEMPSGMKVEIIPDAAKITLGELAHASDLRELLRSMSLELPPRLISTNSYRSKSSN